MEQHWSPEVGPTRSHFNFKGRAKRARRKEMQGHPDTHAESTISTSLEPISAAERTCAPPWMDLGVRGWLAERQQSIWDTTMHQKRAPLSRKSTSN